jgi:hypothetical protein
MCSIVRIPGEEVKNVLTRFTASLSISTAWEFYEVSTAFAWSSAVESVGTAVVNCKLMRNYV